MKSIYLYFLQTTESPLLSLLLLSLFTSIIIQILNWLFRALPRREAQIQAILAPQLEVLKTEYSGLEYQTQQRELYRRYRYHPLLALRSALPLFFQLPFLFAAFHALKGLPELEGQSLGFILNLAQPDAMILGYNILPFVMTGVNLLTAFINPEFSFREKLQAIFIALLFLALLYNAPAALLIYWSFNNLFFLLRTAFSRLLKKKTPKQADPLYQKFKAALPAYLDYTAIPFLLLILLTNLLEYLADGEGLYFYRFSKTVPLFVCTFLLYYLVSRKKSSRRSVLSAQRSSRSEDQLRTLNFELPPTHYSLLFPLILTLILHLTGVHPFPASRFVIFAYLSGVYILLTLLNALYTLFQNIRSRLKHPSSRGEDNSELRTLNFEPPSRNDGQLRTSNFEPPKTHYSLLTTLLLLLIPSLHLAAVNPMYLNGWFYPLFFLLPFVLFAFAWLLLKSSTLIWQKEQHLPNRLISNYATDFAILFTFLPVFRAMLQKNSAHDGDFWLILLGTLSLLYYIYLRRSSVLIDRSRSEHLPSRSDGQLRTLNFEPPSRSEGQLRTLNFEPPSAHYSLLTTLFLLLLFTLHFAFSLYRGEKPSKRKLQSIPALISELEIHETPNIYLFVYDGMPNPRVFREQNLPLKPMQELFEHYGYTVYEDTYTLGNESLNSMAMTLNISGEQYPSQAKMQDIYSGNSVINLILRRLGYGSYNLLENYFTGTYAMVNEDLITEYYPPKVLSDVQGDFFLTLLRGVLQGEFRFDTKGIMAEDRHTEDDRQKRKYELIRDAVRPKFVIDQVSIPSHSQNSGKCLPNETELWVERYYDALEYLKKDLETLHEYDPEAIAIFIGDHGPSLLGDCYVLQNYKREDITAELIWDRIGTLIAVKWPDSERAAKYDADLTLNQDLFAVILSYLADDPRPLELMPERTFSGYGLLTRPAIRFRRGTVF